MLGLSQPTPSNPSSPQVCLTSNVMCKTVRTYSEHHLLSMLKHGHPFVLCTDDKGVFDFCCCSVFISHRKPTTFGSFPVF